MAQHAFFYNQIRCNGCKTCEMACKDYHDLPAERTYSRVFEYEGSNGWTADDSGCFVPASMFAYYVQVSCNHCSNPACVSACPTGACSKDAATGIVSIDPQVCNGTGACIDACPYSAPVMNPDTKKATKCDGCLSRLKEGQLPMCVEACPQRALTCGDADKVPDGYKQANVAPLPDPGKTTPNLYILASKSAQLFDSAQGRVSNLPEVE